MLKVKIIFNVAHLCLYWQCGYKILACFYIINGKYDSFCTSMTILAFWLNKLGVYYSHMKGYSTSILILYHFVFVIDLIFERTTFSFNFYFWTVKSHLIVCCLPIIKRYFLSLNLSILFLFRTEEIHPLQDWGVC